MLAIPATYRLVQLDSPVEQWHDPLARYLFEEMIALRIAGYGRKYPPGVIPFDVSCWYATHFLVCDDRKEMRPVMGFQQVTLQRYPRHYAAFAPLSSCRQAGCARHVQAMEELVARFENRPEKLAYTGGFTVDPELRADRELIGELCRLMVALQYLFHEEAGEGHEIVTAPTIRFKMDSLLSAYGFVPLLDGDDGAGTVTFASYAGEEVRFMWGRDFNQDMVQLAEKYRSWWDNRLLLGALLQEHPAARPSGAPADAAVHRDELHGISGGSLSEWTIYPIRILFQSRSRPG